MAAGLDLVFSESVGDDLPVHVVPLDVPPDPGGSADGFRLESSAAVVNCHVVLTGIGLWLFFPLS